MNLSNNYTKYALLLGVIIPFFFATPATHAAQDPKITAACSATVDASSAQINRGLSERDAKYETAKTTRLQTIEKGRDASDQKLAASRLKADATYQSQYDTLAASVTSDEEIAAVQDFQKAMNDAITTQRTKTDAAIKAYRDGVDEIILNRKLTIGAALDTLESSIDTVVTSAKASCDDSATATLKVNPKTDGIADARQTFKESIATLATTDAKLAALSKDRDTAIAAINKAFAAQVQVQTDKLKAAFGEE